MPSVSYGSTLTDLGRNMVASETTRNALQAALSASAAQENIARTQAGTSRYSTDAQERATKLNYALKILEDERLRAATEREAGLRGQEITAREAGNRLQFNPNTTEELANKRQADKDIARIVAEAQGGRISPQAQAEWFRTGSEIEQQNSLIDSTVAQANLLSDQRYDDIFKGRNWLSRQNILGMGTNDEEARSKYLKEALVIPGAFGEQGKFLIPQITPDGRVRFTGKKMQVPRLNLGPSAASAPSATAASTNAVPDVRDFSRLLSEGSAPLPATTETPISIDALSRIVGGANANSAPSGVTMLPTNRAAAMAATAFDPVLADALRRATARIQELVARGFTPQQATLKAQAEMPVAIRQRIADLQRGVTAP